MLDATPGSEIATLLSYLSDQRDQVRGILEGLAGC